MEMMWLTLVRVVATYSKKGKLLSSVSDSRIHYVPDGFWSADAEASIHGRMLKSISPAISVSSPLMETAHDSHDGTSYVQV